MKNFFKDYIINPVCNFFKKFWYIILLPAGAFIISILFRKPNATKEIKEDIKAIEKEARQVEEISEVIEEAETIVLEQVEDVKEVLQENIDSKEIRDTKAKEFFPGL